MTLFIRPKSATVIYRVARVIGTYDNGPGWESAGITDMREFRTANGADAYARRLSKGHPGSKVVTQTGIVHWYGDNDEASAECDRLQAGGIQWE